MAMITRFLTGLANGKCVKVVIIKTGLTSVYDCISLYGETDLRQVGSFLKVLRFPPPIKLTATIYLKYC